VLATTEMKMSRLVEASPRGAHLEVEAMLEEPLSDGIHIHKQAGSGPVTALCIGQKRLRFPSSALETGWGNDCGICVVYHGIGGTLHIQHDQIRILSVDVFHNHSIQGIKEVDDHVIVFGDKSIRLYRWLQPDVSEPNSAVGPVSKSPVLVPWARFTKMPDLILDVVALRKSCTSLVVGYAHNFIEHFVLRPGSQPEFELKHRVQCPVVCALFSLSFAPVGADQKLSHVAIASGTSFGKIILWKVCPSTDLWAQASADAEGCYGTDSIRQTYEFQYDASNILENSAGIIFTSTTRPPVGGSSLHAITRSFIPQTQHILIGHEGVIFRIVWSETGEFIATVSDDRTVRVWLANTGQQLYVGWGHIARLWDAVFLGSGWSMSSAQKGDRLVATCSEDGTIRVWDTTFAQLPQNIDNTAVERTPVPLGQIGDPVEVDSSYCLKRAATTGDDKSSKNVDNSKQRDNLISMNCVCIMRSHPLDLWRLEVLPGGADIRGVFNLELVCGGNDGCLRYWDLDSFLVAASFDPANTSICAEIPVHKEVNMVTSTLESVATVADEARDVDDNMDVEAGLAEGVNDPATSNPTKPKRTKGKPKAGGSKQPLSKRINGVCSLFISPHGQYVVVVLLDGTIWVALLRSNVVEQSQAYDQRMHGQDLRRAQSYDWFHSYSHEVKAITTAAVSFRGDSLPTACDTGLVPLFDCSLAWPNGMISHVCLEVDCDILVAHLAAAPLSSPSTSVASDAIRLGGKLFLQRRPVISWHAHVHRATVLSYLHIMHPRCRGLQFLVSMAAAGICRVWAVDTDTGTPKVAHSLECITGGRANIGTSVAYVPVCSPSDQLELSSQEVAGQFVIGDSRGSISVYSYVPNEGAVENSGIHDDNGVTAPFSAQLSQFFANAHGTDPVSALWVSPTFGESNNSTTAFLSVGHDGDLHVYRRLARSCDSSQIFEHVHKLSCLPVRTPTCVHVPPTSGSIIVGGFQGSHYICWDMASKRELMRAEGGSWKRPHVSNVITVEQCHANAKAGDAVKTALRVVFGSGVPLKIGSALAVCDNMRHTLTKPIDVRKVCYAEGTKLFPHGLKQTGNCTAILDVGGTHKYVAVGGEEGMVLLLDASKKLGLIQELQMPNLVAAKTISNAVPSGSSLGTSAGIVVAAGGRLTYSVWRMNRALLSMDPSVMTNNALALSSWGSIRPNASQDHRILCSACVSLNDTQGKGSEAGAGQWYSVIFGDSRGHVTIASHFEPVDILAADTSLTDELIGGPDNELNSVGDRSKRLHILEDLVVSEYPITSSALQLHSVNDSVEMKSFCLLACFGDTSGNIFIWNICVCLRYNLSSCGRKNECLAMRYASDIWVK
jgi:WD40 repeat protein